MQPDFSDDAVNMMKNGAPPYVVYQHLVGNGVHDHEARALIDRLVMQKQQAEALDPNRLRDEAKWMLAQGAPLEHVVQHFVRAGIVEAHARPEAERLAAIVRSSQPCDGCRMPVLPNESFFDRLGRQVCKRCNSLNEIGDAQRRSFDNTLEAVGIPAWAIQAANSQAYQFEQELAPYCRHCNAYSGAHVNTLPPVHRASVPHGWTYVCGRCLGGIR